MWRNSKRPNGVDGRLGNVVLMHGHLMVTDELHLAEDLAALEKSWMLGTGYWSAVVTSLRQLHPVFDGGAVEARHCDYRELGEKAAKFVLC